MSRVDGKQGAGREPYQIEGEGQFGRFVKVIDAPDQPALDIPPGTEILDVQVAHGQHPGRLVQVGAQIGPELHPAIESGAQERKCSFGHALVLQLEVGSDQLRMNAEPCFVLAG